VGIRGDQLHHRSFKTRRQPNLIGLLNIDLFIDYLTKLSRVSAQVETRRIDGN